MEPNVSNQEVAPGNQKPQVTPPNSKKIVEIFSGIIILLLILLLGVRYFMGRTNEQHSKTLNNFNVSPLPLPTWTACNSGNSYCGTGRSVAEKQDPNTGLVWSPIIDYSTWFVANNCVVPGGAGSLGATCEIIGDPGCTCVKNTSSKTGCENYDDLNWRLPNQKELRQSYIDGSYSNLTIANTEYWSSTTFSNGTQYAWNTSQYLSLIHI